ncbi:MAG: TolC family protein [Candidatus Binatia bacterium]
MLSLRNIGWLLSSIFFLNGCASVALNAGFDEVQGTVEERAKVKIYWNNGTDLDKEASEKVRSLLKDKLTADEAVQVALLNNRELQASYSALGVAQADLVQAGVLRNPIFDAAVLFPVSGGGKPDLDLSVVMNFLDIFYLPLRQRVAGARFDEAKTRVTGLVLDFASRVRTAFYLNQSNNQMLELRQTIVEALGASFEIAKRLHEAGNITDLDFFRERSLLESSKLALRASEVGARQSREELNVLLGLWGNDTQWQSEERLRDVPEQPVQTENLESVALARSVDLLNARQRIIASGQLLGFNRITALIPELHAGAIGERMEGSWEVGPTIEFPIPLFDQGQARVGRAAAELRAAQQEYYALAVRIRGMARVVRERVNGARERALYYRDIILPLRERIVNEAQLQYNAMQLGPFQLLRAKEQQIKTAVAYIETLRDYWLARGDAGQLLSGRLPGSMSAPMSGTGAQAGASEREGH